MSAFPSNSLITLVLDLITEDTPHIGLYTSNPQADNSGTEVSGGSYARLPVTFTRTGGQLKNNVELRFTMPTATVSHYGILNALTSGDLKVYGAVASTLAVTTNDELIFPVNSITLNFAGS
jgi:hypothetical protein